MRVARPAERDDLPELLRMRRLLFSDTPDDRHRADLARYFRDDHPPPGTVGNEGCLVVLREDGAGLSGFAELMLRSHAEGAWEHTTDGRMGIAHLEAWWVDPAARRGGVGRALVAAAEAWARAEGSPVLTSDALLGNLDSQEAHRALGFREVERIVCFIKAT